MSWVMPRCSDRISDDETLIGKQSIDSDDDSPFFNARDLISLRLRAAAEHNAPANVAVIKMLMCWLEFLMSRMVGRPLINRGAEMRRV